MWGLYAEVHVIEPGRAQMSLSIYELGGSSNKEDSLLILARKPRA